jgi:hypothetical protein
MACLAELHYNFPLRGISAREIAKATVRQAGQSAKAGMSSLNFLSDIGTPCLLPRKLIINALYMSHAGNKITKQIYEKCLCFRINKINAVHYTQENILYRGKKSTALKIQQNIN